MKEKVEFIDGGIEKEKKRLTHHCDGCVAMFRSDTTKGLVAKAGNNVSVVREANSYGEERSGGGGRADSSVEEDDEQYKKGNEDVNGSVKSEGADDKQAEGSVQGGD
ncbi:uncharacterized protein MONOS_15132 [Monocercomonoides exilis]|uniref:uncharacterized protein n=1 Tax=Monocercomonoides exilis TaxID=2049356 RepID=UPI00355A54E7|nr:hypothetical protein MONOS_15132 [Monocercomonoides exilis]|eukprot:MONOS_15132.1-p1 / transcript=MONOS_15132.1 / gene=MONOS_15132 / organism=Monocercomonoides_exilis_PA203 / gene_product=unspecified product / transcript_product=unspecified product / location=Mono_scaffold01152:7628-8118(+) / protein_length=107 / sequence_SO=supercontig / SO=protein_coding / is_pseudo=false